jgi:hypothetical protein
VDRGAKNGGGAEGNKTGFGFDPVHKNSRNESGYKCGNRGDGGDASTNSDDADGRGMGHKTKPAPNRLSGDVCPTTDKGRT